MITNLEKKITLRFLKTKKRDGFINVISTFSFIGISLGVAVLIIVMSVMNGFRNELTNKIIGFNAHVVIKPYEKKINLSKIKELKKNDITNYLLVSNSSEGVLINKDFTKGILLRGYNRESFKKLNIVSADKFKGNKNLN